MKHLYTTLLSIGLAVAAHAQLSGPYTVGGSNPDYSTLTAAVSDLGTQGAAGAVTFNIRPGTYTGQYTLGAIPGTPGDITFRNASNGAEAVNLEFDASEDADNFIFEVDGTDGVAFEKLTFRPLDQAYARAIEFFNDILGFRIEQCEFHGSPEPASLGSSRRALVRCDQSSGSMGENPEDVVMTDNSFFSGNKAISLRFSSTGGTRSQGLVITGNTCVDQVGTGISVTNAVGLIADNSLSTTAGVFYTGIRTMAFDGGSQVLRNRVVANGTNRSKGIQMSNTQSTTGNLIANNMVYVEGAAEVRGISVFNIWGVKILHNSVLVAGGDPEMTSAFYHLGNYPDGQDAVLRNNIFADRSGSPVYVTEIAGNIAEEDHSILFTTGAVLARIGDVDYADLAAYQAGTGRGADDIAMDPVFAASPDLHMLGCAFDNLGQYMPEVSADLDGEPRADPACDIGADEFDAAAGTVTVQLPAISLLDSELPYELGFNAPFSTYQWSTGANTPTIDIMAGGDYTCLATDANGCMYTMAITVEVEITTVIGAPEAPAGLSLYPVPANDHVTVRGLAGVATLTINDMSGRTVQRGSITSAFSVGRLQPGAYIAIVQQASGQRDVFRLVVE